MIKSGGRVQSLDSQFARTLFVDGPDRAWCRGDRPVLQYADWSDRLELGLPLIDEQHKRFFDLAASFSGNGDGVRVMKTLVILSDYIRSHLREEEALMAAARYPGLEAHRLLHTEFRLMLADLLGRARKMSLDEIGEEVKYLVNGWFYQHIITVDFEYAPYLVPGREHLRTEAKRGSQS